MKWDIDWTFEEDMLNGERIGTDKADWLSSSS